MSAYIVSDNTIHAIVGFAWGNGYSPNVSTVRDWPGTTTPHGYILLRDQCHRTTPSRIGQLLLHENYLSVNYRYREDDQTPRYTFKRFDVFDIKGTRRPLKPIDIVKLCDCLDYQSCEHPGWPDSWARDFLTRVKDVAMQTSPEYEAAPWGLD